MSQPQQLALAGTTLKIRRAGIGWKRAASTLHTGRYNGVRYTIRRVAGGTYVALRHETPADTVGRWIGSFSDLRNAKRRCSEVAGKPAP